MSELLQRLLDAMSGRSVLVVGDVMLDHFVYGGVTRISPEAPVPVVHFQRDEYRLGGAANVAHNIVSLGGRASLVGLVGDDPHGRQLRADLDRLGVGTAGLTADPARCTTRKVRIVTTRNQQVARIDYESDAEVAGALETLLAERIAAESRRADAILISDYLKGVISRGVASACVAAARAHGIPLLVDPKVAHVDAYAGATIVTPNHHEAEAITHLRVRSSDEARAAALRFRERVGCASVLITRGEHGMWLLTPDGECDLPAEAREVADVTGAGDTVISALALGLAAGGSLADAARLANRAAGIVVGRFGPSAVTVPELRASLSGTPEPAQAS
jgi:D-beta-D-heptose 7-phosphate kinase/D-beta-D-heptose 1-phosphate adenosyltransferase